MHLCADGRERSTTSPQIHSQSLENRNADKTSEADFRFTLLWYRRVKRSRTLLSSLVFLRACAASFCLASSMPSCALRATDLLILCEMRLRQEWQIRSDLESYDGVLSGERH